MIVDLRNKIREQGSVFTEWEGEHGTFIDLECSGRDKSATAIICTVAKESFDTTVRTTL